MRLLRGGKVIDGYGQAATVAQLRRFAQGRRAICGGHAVPGVELTGSWFEAAVSTLHDAHIVERPSESLVEHLRPLQLLVI